MTFSRYVIDTHALLWYLMNSPRLGRLAGEVLDDLGVRLYLPIVALAEACWYVEHKSSTLASVADLLAQVDGDPRIEVVPVDRRILDIANTLSVVGEMHDRQIVATALLLAQDGPPVAMLTLDENIRASGLVPVVW